MLRRGCWRWRGKSGPAFECLTDGLVRAYGRDVGSFTHRSRGRTEDLRFAACVTADTTDSSMPCAAQIELIDASSSRSVGSPASAGISLLRSSAAVFGSGTGVARADSGSGGGDGREGAVNLTPGFVYGRERLCSVSLETKSRFRRRNTLTRHDSYDLYVSPSPTSSRPLQRCSGETETFFG